jgi:hypothetical protein
VSRLYNLSRRRGDVVGVVGISMFAAVLALAGCAGKKRPFSDLEASANVESSAPVPPDSGSGRAETPGDGIGQSPSDTAPRDDDLLTSLEISPGSRLDAGTGGAQLDGGIETTCATPSARDCSSNRDNDCDGQPDDVVDSVCKCAPGTVIPCDEHPGLDGRGQCRAGLRTCVLAEGNLTSDWSECEGAVGPGEQDSCALAGDDTNCDGTPNGGCSCVNGQTIACGPNTDTGICQRGTSTCASGSFGQCQGAVFPAPRDSCSTQGDDSNCNGVLNDGCACIDGQTQACGPDTDTGICQRGTRTCVGGSFGQCVGAVFAAPRNCASQQDNDCDGRADNTLDNACTCIIGQTQVCGEHPGQDGNGQCRAGQRRCEAASGNSSSAFGACTGSVGPAPQDSCSVEGDDANCNGAENDRCECVVGQGNGPCSNDPNNSRCNGQGQCVPCQADADCSLVGGGRRSCGGGQCFASEVVVGWQLRGDIPTQILPPTSTAANVTGTDLTRSNAFEPGPAFNFYAAIDWPRDGLNLNKYFQFGVSANTGSSVTFDRLEFAISSTNANDGSADWEIRSSVDGFGTPVAEGTILSVAFPGTSIAPSIRSVGTRSGTVTFRLYIYNLQGDGEVPFVGIRGPSSGGSSLLMFGAVN